MLASAANTLSETHLFNNLNSNQYNNPTETSQNGCVSNSSQNLPNNQNQISNNGH